MGMKENQDNNFQLPKKPKLAKLKKRPLAKRFKIRRAMKNCKWLPRVLYCLIRNRILFGPWLCSMSGGLARNRKCTTDKWPEEVVWRTQYRSAERQSLLFHCSSSEEGWAPSVLNDFSCHMGRSQTRMKNAIIAFCHALHAACKMIPSCAVCTIALPVSNNVAPSIQHLPLTRGLWRTLLLLVQN